MAIGYRALRRNEPLAPHTSFGIGGPASFFYEPFDAEEIMALLELAETETDILVLGYGTNILVADEGFYGLVIKLTVPTILFDVTRVDPKDQTCLVTASGASRWDDLVRWCIYENGLAGIECLSGIPGTVGAAVAGNIGAYGQQVSDVFESAQFIRLPDSDHSDKIELQSTKDVDCDFVYRDSSLRNTVITQVTLRLRRDALGNREHPQVAAQTPEGAKLIQVRRAVMDIRSGKDMLLGRHRSAGSFFKNPTVNRQTLERLSGQFGANGWYQMIGEDEYRVYAAKLVEAAGYHPGHRQGLAGLSPQHALALVAAHPDCKAIDILDLAVHIHRKVQTLFGVSLEPEVRLVGYDDAELLF